MERARPEPGPVPRALHRVGLRQVGAHGAAAASAGGPGSRRGGAGRRGGGGKGAERAAARTARRGGRTSHRGAAERKSRGRKRGLERRRGGTALCPRGCRTWAGSAYHRDGRRLARRQGPGAHSDRRTRAGGDRPLLPPSPCQQCSDPARRCPPLAASCPRWASWPCRPGKRRRPQAATLGARPSCVGEEEQGTQDWRYPRLPVAGGRPRHAGPQGWRPEPRGQKARTNPHASDTAGLYARPPTPAYINEAPPTGQSAEADGSFPGSHWLAHTAKCPRPPPRRTAPHTARARAPSTVLCTAKPRPPATTEADGTLPGSDWPRRGRPRPGRRVTQRGGWRRPLGRAASRSGTGRRRVSPVSARPPPHSPPPCPACCLGPEPARLGAASGRGPQPPLTGPGRGPVRPAGPGLALQPPHRASRPTPLARRLCDRSMSEGESKQVPSGGSDSKPESASSGPGMTSVSAPVTSAAPPEEEEEEESEDESEILEESPCGRWQKRREEVSTGCAGEPGSGGPRPGPRPPRRLPAPHLSPGQLGPGAERPSCSRGRREMDGPSPAAGQSLLGLRSAEAGAAPVALPACPSCCRPLCAVVSGPGGVAVRSRECLWHSCVPCVSWVFFSDNNEEQ